MTSLATKRIWVIAAVAIACAGCESIGSLGGGTKSMSAASAQSTGSSASYGNENSVQTTIDVVKMQGDSRRVSSMAVRLPERPLGEIAVYTHRYPDSCGGHEFRVYEATETQILEYSYAGRDGKSHLIRDYVTGPSPFVAPGLWGAYDHTADSISTMTAKLEQRGDRLFDGVYSQGLVTGLPNLEQRTLGNAYQKALNDISACGYAASFARVLTD